LCVQHEQGVRSLKPLISTSAQERQLFAHAAWTRHSGKDRLPGAHERTPLHPCSSSGAKLPKEEETLAYLSQHSFAWPAPLSFAPT
jgi:hypothetical protein